MSEDIIQSKLYFPGGSISFFQSVCVLGYCLLPLVLSLILCMVVLLAEQNLALVIVRYSSKLSSILTNMLQFVYCRCIIVLAGFVWSTFASMQFLGDCNPAPRRALAVYPMFLFYLIVGWMVISHTD